MAQFDGGKYSKKGVLSYNYLGGEGGAGKGPVSIIKKGDDWFFADKSGKVRTSLPDGGKLNSTHINNLERDGIFKSAKIDPQGNKLSAAKIKAGPDTESFGDSKSITGSGDGIGVDAEGGLAPELAQRGNLRLSGRDAYDPTNAPPSLSSPGEGGSIDYKKTLERRGMAPAPTAASGINPNEATQIAPASGGVTTSNFGGGREMGIGNNTFSSAPNQTMTSSPHATTVWQGSTTAAPNSAVTGIYGPPGSDNSNMTGTGWQEPNRFSTREAQQSFSPPGASSTSNNFSASSAAQGPPSVVNNPGSEFGEQGPEGGPIIGGEDFDASPEGATSAVPGIGGKDDSSWGAADWNAVGSVMKGVGGLASAYTGIKNYQLARDAHNTQKNQWQANYNQRLKAYEDNKKMANQDIEARNRTLAARGNTSAKYEKL